MHLRITCDANADSGVGQVVDAMSGPTRRHFLAKHYGVGLSGIVVVLMCRDPERNFQPRLRFAQREKAVYLDVMLDLTQMRQVNHEARMQIIRERLVEEIPIVVCKYSIVDFDEKRLAADLKSWMAEIAPVSDISLNNFKN